MQIQESILKNDEKIALNLRSLYAQKGYRPFKMSKFEEYDLYMKNKDFLISQGIITFNEPGGNLLALKPDVTLSIVKNAKDQAGLVQKFYYSENVYRLSERTHSYQELMQTGLECIGDIALEDICEVVQLAVSSAAQISPNYQGVFSHIGLLKCYFADWGIDLQQDLAICEAFFRRNADGLKSLCTNEQLAAILALMAAYPDAESAKAKLLPYCVSHQTLQALEEFVQIWNNTFRAPNPAVSVDFSVSDSLGYYSGVVFKFYISGVSAAILSGGQYDGLMKKMGRASHAIGFAVYLDELARLDDPEAPVDPFINVALPKGRLGEKVYAMFEKAGFDCPSIKEQNRKLIFENPQKGIRFFWVKPSDVAIYVAHGAADIGVAGYDILAEYNPDVLELCDTKLGVCRMAVAAKKTFVDDESKTLRVATKFAHIAQKFYADKCRDIDIIHLNGSIELAPILGLSDVIVDIVETGKTLLENDLEPIETILPISARLISNKASYRFKQQKIEQIRESIAKQVQDQWLKF